MKDISVREAAIRFLSSVAAEVAPSTLALYSLYVNRFVERFGRKRMAAISPAIVRAWGVTYHPVQAVQRLFSWSHREARIIAVNPLDGMRKMSRGRRLRVIDRGVSLRLQRFAIWSFRHFLLALDLTIARPGELRRARWVDVRVAGLGEPTADDLVSGRAFFFFDTFKAQSLRKDAFAVRIIPIPPRLGRMLVRFLRTSPSADCKVFLNSRGAGWTINAVRCQFRALRLRAGLSTDHRGENVVAYTLRHSGATAAIVAGVELAALAGVMGHADIRMTNRYVHLSPAFLAQAVDRIHQAKTRPDGKSGLPGSLRTRPDDPR